MESMMNTMAPAAFYYYNPDPSPEARQHGHFIPHPHQQMPIYPVVPTVPSTPVYSRPNSSCSQQQQHMLPMKAFTSIPAHMMTPMPSPPAPSAATVTSSTVLSHPVAHKPAIMLETEFCDADGLRYPSTPPLSTTSSISSPGSCDMLATPLNPMFSGLDSFDGLKESCVSDVASDKLPLAGWSNCSSPPLTPVYIHTQVPGKTAPSKQISASVSSDLLSVSACPSLSPSPSPYPRSEQDNDFCDPRNLTVSSVDGALSPEFSSLSSLSAEDDFIKSESLAAQTEFDQSLTSGLLEDFPELESEDDFLNGLVNLAGESSSVSSATTPASGDLSIRSRASSSASSAHSEFECGEFFNNWESSAEAEHPSKRQRTASGSAPAMTSAADATSATKTEQSPASSEDAGSVSDNNATNSVSSGSPSNTGNDMTAMPAPTNRRGRKQSLTEDPSKIFACDLCNRRFRRQEHLKRHYRSLHTQEKPFNCHECGKKFSRSDNLAQHARTHGAGAFVMNLYDDPEIVAAATGYPPHPMYAPHAMAMAEDYNNMGRVLFQVAAEVPGSGSDLSSDDASDAQKQKKRKRMD